MESKKKKNFSKTIYLLSSLILFILTNFLNSQTVWYPLYPGVNTHLFSMDFTNINTGYVVGTSTIIKTTNAGNYWTIQNPNTNKELWSIDFVDANTGYTVGGYYPNSIIRKTTNGGDNWFSQSSGINRALFTVFFVNTNTGYVGGGDGSILKTIDGGAIWFPLNTGTNQIIEEIYFMNDNTGFAAGRIGTLLKTTNSGITWNFKNTGSNNWLYSIKFVNSNTGYCVGGTIYSPYDHIVLKTTNGGDNWFIKKSGIGFWLESFWLSGVNNIIAVGSNGTIIKTDDGGNNWVTQTSGASSTLTKVFFTDFNTGYITGFNSTILKTTNGGMSPLIPILISPPNGSDSTSLTPTLLWNNISGVNNYKVQVSTISNFSVITDSATVSSNQYTISAGKLLNAITYFWRVNATDSSGTGPWSEVWSFSTIPVGIKKISTSIPEEYNLFQNYPNPFNPSTHIKFDIPSSSYVKIIIYDNIGKEVTKLVDRKLSAGSYEVNWDGSSYPSGVYFYKLISDEFVDTKKMLLLK